MAFWDSIFGSSALPSSPTGQSVQSGSIQPWAQPYINSYLNRAQQLTTNAQPTDFQKQVWSSAQGMQNPSQFAAGSDLAQQAGQGQLSTAPTALAYGQQGSNIGQQGVGIGALGMNYGMNAGQNYAQQATNPYAVGAYMNPYMQQSLAPQLALLNQQQQLGSQDINAKAVGQGAFGGNRATLAQGLNAQNYDLARQKAIGEGYNTAFNQAQQAQQFGANLGLQGAQQGVNAGLAGLASGMQGTSLGLQGVQGAQAGYTGANQSAAALGNIGAQQGQYDLSKLQLQNQIANQQYNLPFQNQQYMQGMMAGLPISTQTTQSYQAPPNAFSQAAGLGTTALGAYLGYKALGSAAAGGLPKDFKKVQSYADGGSVDHPDGTVWSETQGQWVQPGPNSGAMPSPIGNGIGDLVGGVSNNSPVSSDDLSNLYQQYLGRGVDQSGAQSWTGQSRQDVMNGIMNSPEYQGMHPQQPTQRFGRMMGASPQGTDLANLQLNRLLGTAA
jgi:hypothetical protein